jgi:hypothetical protein
MIWATLALLGIPIWLIAVVLIAAFRNRNAVRSNPDEFDYKVRKDDGWQRKKGYARWVSDVLIFHAGIALIRSDAVQVEAVEVLDTVELPSKGLGDTPNRAARHTHRWGNSHHCCLSAESRRRAWTHEGFDQLTHIRPILCGC